MGFGLSVKNAGTLSGRADVAFNYGSSMLNRTDIQQGTSVSMMDAPRQTAAGFPFSPRPSSDHNGIIHVAFASGSGRGINSNIDRWVYTQLLTPNGQRQNQNVVDPGSF